MTKYIIEIWNPETNKYIKCWEGNDYQRAMIMIDKPYYRNNTRRLIRIQQEIIWGAKKNKRVKSWINIVRI